MSWIGVALLVLGILAVAAIWASVRDRAPGLPSDRERRGNGGGL